MNSLANPRFKQPRPIKLVEALIIGCIILVFFFGPLLTKADTDTELITDYEGVIQASDPLLVNSMKTTMYEHVADDEEIDIVFNWIKNGAQDDTYFAVEVLPIMKNNCTKCHNTTSTMSDAAPEKPLTTYQEIKLYLNPGLPSKPSK